MDATPLFDDTAFLAALAGPADRRPRRRDHRRRACGAKHALLLAHHGLLTAGRTVQEAAFLAVFMERMARQQIDAAKVGGAKPIDADEARRARDFLRTDRIMNITFDAWVRKTERRRGVGPQCARHRPPPMKSPRAWLEGALGATSGTVLFLMMMITAVDVVGRYVFNKPLNGGFEITEMLLAALIYCGLPLVSQRREHIVIDTFDPLMSARVKRGLDVLAEIVCSLTLAGIGYLIFRRAARVAEYGDTTNVLKLPLAPVAYLMGTMIIVAVPDPPVADLRAAWRRRRQEHRLSRSDRDDRSADRPGGDARAVVPARADRVLDGPDRLPRPVVDARPRPVDGLGDDAWSTSRASSTRCRSCRSSS